MVDVEAYEAAVGGRMPRRAADEGPRTPQGRDRPSSARPACTGGDLLPGSYDEWVVPRRERLITGHQRMLDRLIGLLEQQGDYRAAIEHGQERLRLDPLDERVYRWLMRLHALNQDRAGSAAGLPGVRRRARA